MDNLIARLDDLGKPAWITLMVLGFIIFWPIGLGILAYLIWSGRMGCGRGGRGRWQEYWMSRRGNGGGRWYQGAGGGSSGNRAFDEYREETLKRLEEEQKEFMEFLERLRMAKDKAEFDQFMAERRAGPAGASGAAQSFPPEPA